MLEPMPVQSPFAAGRNQLVADRRLQDVQPVRPFARGRQRRKPELVQSQLIPQKSGHPAGTPLTRPTQSHLAQMGGESTEAWRTVLDDLVRRGLRRPELLIVDGGAGLESAIAAVWDSVPVQRCTVHKHRNLLAHAPERLHEEITDDYNEMIYAKTPDEIEKHRKAFIRKWRLKHEAVANSLEEAGDRLFTFTRL